MTERYLVVENLNARKWPGYELVDMEQTPPCTFAVGLQEQFAVRIADQLNNLHDALDAAETHLCWIGWGDSWERECAGDLPDKIAKTLARCP